MVLGASSDAFSSAHSGSILGAILNRLLGHPLPPRQFELLHFLIRKASHLTEYAILGALLLRALRAGASGWRWSWALGAVVLALCVAATDEWHQMFLPSRTGTGWDVVLDGVGAFLGCAVARLRSRVLSSEF